MNVASALEKLGISTTSRIAAVQQVRAFVESEVDHYQPSRCSHLIDTTLGIYEQFYDIPYAIKVAQAVFDEIVGQGCEVDDPQQTFERAKVRADAFIKNPANAWMFATAAPTTTTKSVEVATVTDKIDVKVEVKADGKMKKGGKAILAEALYEKFVVKATEPISNMDFVKMLEKDLGMSLAGARTYAANCKKKFAK